MMKIEEFIGCLKSDIPSPGIKEEKKQIRKLSAEAAIKRDRKVHQQRKRKQKSKRG